MSDEQAQAHGAAEPQDQAELHAAVLGLIEQSELQTVRLSRLHVETAEVLPDEVSVEVGMSGVNAHGDRGDPGYLVVTISHAARFTSGDDVVALVECSHTAHFRYDGSDRPDDDTIGKWVMGTVYFMLYPYVRQALQSACMQVGIPPVVLGYLKRGELIPRNITVVVNSTQLATAAEEGRAQEGSLDSE